MRNLLLTLLLINLLAYAYQHWIIEPETVVDPLVYEQTYPGLILARKDDKPAMEPVPEKNSPPANAAVSLDSSTSAQADLVFRCLKMGPFARNADADLVRAALQSREAVVRQSSEEGRVWVGHWVKVVGMKNRGQAEAARTKLAASGIPDAYILPDSEDFPVSLGVFRARASADRAVKKAKDLGYGTLIEERYQPGVNIWLWVRLPAGRSIGPGEFTSASGQILRTETVACENTDG